MSNNPETIEATLSRIVFQNDNGFIIGAFTDEHNNKISGLGNMVNPQVNMNYILTGYYEDNHKYGEQFKFSFYETVIPVDINGVFKFIVRLCKFVGPTVGNAIVDKYGEKTLLIMKTNPEKLSSEISGITLTRAKEIQATLLENENIEKVMVELETILDVPGMLKKMSGELIKIYKSQAAETVKANPYILTNFRGMGFPLADRVALNIGFARDSIERKKAACMHCMRENMQEGSVWISEELLINNIQVLIQVPDLVAGMVALVGEGVVVGDDIGGVNGGGSMFYALDGPAMDEVFIADVLAGW